MQEYLKRFDTIPDIIDLDHLTISGNVNMGANVTLKVFLSLPFESFVGDSHHHCTTRSENRHTSRSDFGKQTGVWKSHNFVKLSRIKTKHSSLNVRNNFIFAIET